MRDPERVLAGRLRLPSDKYPNTAARVALFDRLEARFKSLPGVENASLASSIPVLGDRAQTFEIEGRPSAPDSGDGVQFPAAGPDYFRVLGAALISGRAFSEADRIGSAAVTLVNRSFVERYFPGESPLGRRLRVKSRNRPREWRTVVGVVANIMQGDPTRQHFKPLAYVPIRQEPTAAAFFLLRAGVPPNQVGGAVRSEIRRLDSDLILEEFRTLKASFAFDGDYMDVEHMELGKDAAVAPVFALLALLLAAIGLYAVIAHSVSRRTREIGVRVAVGATPTNILSLILRDGMTPVAIGLLAGLAASLAVNRVLQSQLVGISPYDPATLTGAALTLILVALLACQVPARRAMNVDAAVALRHD